FERGDEATVVILFAQERENIADTFAQHRFATETGEALHRAIPRDDAAIAIEREHTIDARVDHPVQQQCGIILQENAAALCAFAPLREKSSFGLFSSRE